MQSNGMNVFIRFCNETQNSFIMKMVLLTPVGHKLFEDTKRVYGNDLRKSIYRKIQ
jgi:hypothetical protein